MFGPQVGCILKRVLLRFDDTLRKWNKLGLWLVEVGKCSLKLTVIWKMEEGISERRSPLFPNVARVGDQGKKGFVSGADPACLALS